MQIAEQSSSEIDDIAEANKMADAALADLKEPLADMTVSMPFFWPTELGDLYRFTANGHHFDTDQARAVVGFRHSLANRGVPTTQLELRGSTAGAHTAWIDKELTRPQTVLGTNSLNSHLDKPSISNSRFGGAAKF